VPLAFDDYFLFHRELLGELARLAYDTVRDMLAVASDEHHARPGMVDREEVVEELRPVKPPP